MQTDFLIIGQGICGSFLSWYLRKAGYSFLVIDEQQPNTASVTEAGIINPVTGRRIVKTWLIDDVMPFAWQAYTALGEELQVTAIEQKNIVDFFSYSANAAGIHRPVCSGYQFFIAAAK